MARRTNDIRSIILDVFTKNHNGRMTSEQVWRNLPPSVESTAGNVATAMRLMHNRGILDREKIPGTRSAYYRPKNNELGDNHTVLENNQPENPVKKDRETLRVSCVMDGPIIIQKGNDTVSLDAEDAIKLMEFIHRNYPYFTHSKLGIESEAQNGQQQNEDNS